MLFRRLIQKTRVHLCKTMTSASQPSAAKHIKMSEKNNIVWVDLEMSGLDVNTEHILEMACIVTDSDLNIIAESPDIIIHQPDTVLNNMGEWCTKQHGESGLTESVRNSKIDLKSAENVMVEFIKPHIVPSSCPLAGNSVHCDKDFLQKYMPVFMKQLHYRIIDVSTIKELCRRWYPGELEGAPKKKLTHRALDDIRESIEELKYYRKSVFK
ncbi:oligoribonuclease, mitochondrial-like [Saccostrea cucullata]|uniref:oligoribonuclease, mitochondrial-like n=1 Tax=Saccostrea cuccullata TaxID=36930 RepID=UPI002ED3686A